MMRTNGKILLAHGGGGQLSSELLRRTILPRLKNSILAKLADAETLLVSTGKVVATPDSPRGCRTKFATEVRDASKMLMNYSGDLHRVLFCGDHLHAAHQMGHLLGLKVVEEI